MKELNNISVILPVQLNDETKKLFFYAVEVLKLRILDQII
jgi:hypothetical protein